MSGLSEHLKRGTQSTERAGVSGRGRASGGRSGGGVVYSRGQAARRPKGGHARKGRGKRIRNQQKIWPEEGECASTGAISLACVTLRPGQTAREGGNEGPWGDRPAEGAGRGWGRKWGQRRREAGRASAQRPARRPANAESIIGLKQAIQRMQLLRPPLKLGRRPGWRGLASAWGSPFPIALGDVFVWQDASRRSPAVSSCYCSGPPRPHSRLPHT